MKNVRIYTLDNEFIVPPLNRQDLAIAEAAKKPLMGLDMVNSGFVPPPTLGPNAKLVEYLPAAHAVAVCVQRERRLLPASVVRREVAARVAAAEEAEGLPLCRGDIAAIREAVIIELLPRTFTELRNTLVVFTGIGGQKLVLVDAASANEAEEALGCIRRALGSLPVRPLLCKARADAMMTHMVAHGGTNLIPMFDVDCRYAGDDGSASFRNVDPGGESVSKVLEGGARVTALRVTDPVSGVVATIRDDLSLRRVRQGERFALELEGAPSDHTFHAIKLSTELLLISEFIKALIEQFDGVAAA